MAQINVSAWYRAPRASVWAEIRHIDRHVAWMSDAVAIEFTTEQREGPGTSFRCTTKVGPLVTVDLMTITEWVEGTTMGVAHRGIVRGRGSFTLSDEGAGTRLTWREELTFPWWALGPLGAYAARPILHALWAKNLRQLGTLIRPPSDA